MQRKSVYHYTVTDPPGVNVHRLRNERDWSQRQLADACRPALDHTTIRRLEHNQGYTQDTLERVARALGVTVTELFLPAELADWPRLSQPAQTRLADAIADARLAEQARKKLVSGG